jgi:predicted ArsR family transcriptional regulator
VRHLDVIAHPTRLGIIRHLADRGPVDGADLAEAVGVHRNTLRRHLAELEEAGVVVAVPQPGEGRGRPRVEYQLSDDTPAAGEDFRQLAALVTTALARTRPHAGVLRETGEDWGRYLVGRPGVHDPRERLTAVLEELGFTANVDDGGVEMTACPCPMLSPEHPEIVCCLVSGAIAGALAASGSPLRPGEERHDPATRHCTVRLVRVS